MEGLSGLTFVAVVEASVAHMESARVLYGPALDGVLSDMLLYVHVFTASPPHRLLLVRLPGCW